METTALKKDNYELKFEPMEEIIAPGAAGDFLAGFTAGAGAAAGAAGVLVGIMALT